MELVLGQFHRQGAISVWKIAPLFKGKMKYVDVNLADVSIIINLVPWSTYLYAASIRCSGQIPVTYLAVSII